MSNTPSPIAAAAREKRNKREANELSPTELQRVRQERKLGQERAALMHTQYLQEKEDQSQQQLNKEIAEAIRVFGVPGPSNYLTPEEKNELERKKAIRAKLSSGHVGGRRHKRRTHKRTLRKHKRQTHRR
jgi:hypothetical protein